MKGFKTPQVAALSGVNPNTLHYWVKSNFVTPSIAKARGTGTRRLWSFRDLVALRVAAELRAAGISLQGLRRVVRHLQKVRGLASHSDILASSYLVADREGRDVYEVTGEDLVSLLRKPGQGVFAYVVDLGRVVHELREQVVAAA